MGLFSRSIPKGNAIDTTTVEQGDGGSLLESDPLSQHFVAKINGIVVGDAPRDIVLYMLAKQRSAFGTTILQTHSTFRMDILQRQAKYILRKHSPELIKRAIAQGVIWSKNPFTFKYVESTITKVVEKCPFIKESL